jgi:hypothetical protein
MLAHESGALVTLVCRFAGRDLLKMVPETPLTVSACHIAGLDGAHPEYFGIRTMHGTQNDTKNELGIIDPARAAIVE